ncbi:DUF3592 domain-containing protein [Pleurocapsales cyanobacterium LEGE 10410]|nr:DUF3592 domain-containing protein [Pleurocapsales cyanobacterium LEGE 10410]
MNIPLIVGSVLALFGVYMLRHAIASYKYAVASLSWPTTDGHLEDVRLWGKRNIGGEMKDAEKLSVEYSYEINGLNYSGNSAAFYTLVYPKTVEFAERHSSNRNIKVYFNPRDPSESVLEPGLNPEKPYSDFIMGTLGVATGVVIATLAWIGVIG